MESAATVESAVKGWSGVTAAYIGMDGRPISVSGMISVARPIAPTSSIRITCAAVESVAIVAVIPRACTDEHTAREPAGPIIAIGRASVRIISVVTVGTNRRGSYARRDRAHSNTHGNLSVSASCNSKKQNSKQRSIF
jgi:hypothetical protein